jgi:hypothetical protein
MILNSANNTRLVSKRKEMVKNAFEKIESKISVHFIAKLFRFFCIFLNVNL